MSLEEKLKEITSAERVIESTDVLEDYAHDKSFMPQISPRCIVKPINMEELKNIVELANDEKTGLVPLSSGPPHFKGDTVPSISDAVVIDLNDMNRVVRIDSKNKVALIEPGVTFEQLIKALEKEGLAPYMPLVPKSTKSALISYLEREPITIPRDHWEYQDPLLCTEVVYGSGDLFRTGSAAGPGTIEEQWELGRAMIRGLGPTQTDFAKLIQAAQGTMGIVTWATIKCRRLPQLSKCFLIHSDNLRLIIDLVYKILWKRIGNHLVILNNHNLASILSDNEEKKNSLRDQLSTWLLIFNIEGTGLLPEDRVAWQEAAFMQESQKIGLNPKTEIGEVKVDEVMRVLERPSLDPYWKIRYHDGNHDIFFLTTLDRTTSFIDQMNILADSVKYPIRDIGIYLQPTIQGTNCHCEFNLNYDQQDSLAVNKIKALDREASKIIGNMGGFFSRPYGPWGKRVFNRDPASVNALKKVKKIFDPNGIMNPGKLCFPNF